VRYTGLVWPKCEVIQINKLWQKFDRSRLIQSVMLCAPVFQDTDHTLEIFDNEELIVVLKASQSSEAIFHQKFEFIMYKIIWQTDVDNFN
jgi:hypothetical protein